MIRIIVKGTNQTIVFCISKIAKLCDIRGFCYDYELRQPFADQAVECHSIKAIVALIDNDIAVPSEILKYAIERNDIEIARAMLMYDYEIERTSDYVLEIASMLDVAIKVSAPMRDLLFEYFYPLREETGALVLQTALTIHQMRLQQKPFDMIRSGQKTYELRLYDENVNGFKYMTKLNSAASTEMNPVCCEGIRTASL